MADRLSIEERSRLMGRVRQHGTALELQLRKALWAAGMRYRFKTAIRLPGRPDIVFPGARVAVFVDGCFWHGCPLHGTTPKTRTDFWVSKITRNRERDQEVDVRLGELGWRVVRLWEHEVKSSIDECVGRVSRAISGSCSHS